MINLMDVDKSKTFTGENGLNKTGFEKTSN
jgi:hypothetical protein